MMSTVFAFGILSGCGTFVPEIQDLPGNSRDGQLLVAEIVRKVRCEVQEAVQYVYHQDNIAAKYNGKPTLTWFDNWGAQVALNLTVVEKSEFNPGAILNTPMIGANVMFPDNIVLPVAQSYSLGLGGMFSAEATRTENFGAYYTDRKSVV